MSNIIHNRCECEAGGTASCAWVRTQTQGSKSKLEVTRTRIAHDRVGFGICRRGLSIFICISKCMQNAAACRHTKTRVNGTRSNTRIRRMQREGRERRSRSGLGPPPMSIIHIESLKSERPYLERDSVVRAGRRLAMSPPHKGSDRQTRTAHGISHDNYKV